MQCKNWKAQLEAVTWYSTCMGPSLNAAEKEEIKPQDQHTPVLNESPKDELG